MSGNEYREVAMPFDTVKNFAQSGLNTDMIPADLPGNFLTNCKNIRVSNGGVAPYGGYAVLEKLPANKEPFDMIYIAGESNKYWIIAFKDAMYKYETGIIPVTPDAMEEIADGHKWSLTDLSGIAIANHPATGPMFYYHAVSKFTKLKFDKSRTWAQAQQSCEFMVAHKQFLFALGITDAGKFTPDSLRWSAPADIGGVPPTWDHLDTTSTAGYTNLGGSGGDIIGALSMRDALVIYRQRGITVADYVGGRYVWRFRHLSSNSGLISRDAVVDVNGTHYFITDGDICMTDGNMVKSIANNRIKSRINGISKDNYGRSYAAHNPAKDEIMFCIPTVSSDYPNIAYVYNYANDSWTTRDLPRTIKCAYGLTPKTNNMWDLLGTDWDGYNSSWDGDATTPYDYSMVAIVPPEHDDVGLRAKIIYIDNLLGLNIEPFSSIIERTDYLIENLSQVKTIQRVYPHVQSGSSVMIQIGSQQVPGGTINWKPPVEFNPNTQRQVDIRSTGILHAYRVYVDGVAAEFLVSGLDFEYVVDGRR